MATAFSHQQPVWRAPLVSMALALTAGIVIDRFWIVPRAASLLLALSCVLAWLLSPRTSRPWLPLFLLWGAVVAVGAAYHHSVRHVVAATDISHFAQPDPHPIRLRGVLVSSPTINAGQRAAALRTFPTEDMTRFVLRLTQRQDLSKRVWEGTSGDVQVTVRGHVVDMNVGDEAELLGRLSLPTGPMNPGGFDYASFLRDQGITALVSVLETDEVFLARRGWPTSFFGWLAVVRGWGQRTLARDLPSHQAIAAALLLGEGSGMTNEDWDRYQRTGVIHVLAISGQHLVVLAGFLWLAARFAGLPRRKSALVVALLLLAYSLLTGGRPPVMRAAWVILVYCGGILWQRPINRANSFCLAWIGVALMNPTDIFNAGCQLSFLAVAVLIWGAGRLFEHTNDPLQRLIDDSQPWLVTASRRWMRGVWLAYCINLLVWFAVTPLAASNFHIVSPIAILLGPPMAVLTSIALLSGFGFLIFAGWFPPAAWLFGLITAGALQLCDLLVTYAQCVPWAYGFVTDVPTWWLWIFYVALLIGITLPVVWRHALWALLAASAWLLLGVLLELLPHRPGEFHCTFVAVGHGGCTVVETPRGHVSVYDAGATTGPDVTRRHIAPFLWARGIRRIDDLILSHADLDHFNGVIELTERFTIGRMICTPTFAERDLPGMRETLAALERRGIALYIVHSGSRWEQDKASFEVMHPPVIGPSGKENARSLVLCVGFEGRSILLTGDLEEAGLARVLGLKSPRASVLMAPHHGSDKSNIPALAAWARPKVVVSCESAPLNERAGVRMYERLGIPYLGTWPHGAVAIRCDGTKAWAETYHTRMVLDLE